MLRAALIGLLPTCAMAEGRVSVHHDPGPGDGWYARLEIDNRRGTYNLTTTHDTARGPVSLSYTTTPPSRIGDPASADNACVVDLPEGVTAVPMCLDIMEQETGTVLLYQYIGG